MASHILKLIVLYAAAFTFLLTGQVSWAESGASDDNECSSFAPVYADCTALGFITSNWTSYLMADKIKRAYVNISWAPHPNIPPTMQGRYEIYWREAEDEEDGPLMQWRRTPPLNETFYHADINTLNYTFNGLMNGTSYEMRVCISPTPQLAVNSSAPPECGYCSLCFSTPRNDPIEVLAAETTTRPENGMTILNCQATGNPLPVISWDADRSGFRSYISEFMSEDYLIANNVKFDVSPPVINSTLEYDPVLVDFSNPDCIIENEFERIRVTNPEFLQRRGISLVEASVEILMDGTFRYTCEVTTLGPPLFIWEAFTNLNMRFSLSDTDPGAPYVISTTVEGSSSTSTLSYEPGSVDFSEPGCLVEDGVSVPLRVENNQFVQTDSPAISLVSATFEELRNGDILYICEVTSSSPPLFRWEATERGNMRVSLSNNDPDFTITTDIDVSSSSKSQLLFNPNFVQFTDPECIVNTGGAPPLRVTTSEFTENDQSIPDLGATVQFPVWGIVLLVIVPLLVAMGAIGTGLAVKCVMKRKSKRKISMMTAQHENVPNDYSTSIPLKTVSDESGALGPLAAALPKHMIVPSSNIKVSTVVGQGEFGVVYKGTLTRDNQQELVAVKTLKGIFATANDIQSFTEEILILKQFDHPNVMSLIGVCLGADKVGGGPSIILPFMSKGSLLNFLRKGADRLVPPKDADIEQIGAVEKNLIQICLQVARGMEYLAAQKFVHRDLAARNCMIDQYDQIRVGDFGLTEDIYSKNYFRLTSGDGVKLPVKWMAPECLKFGVFSEKSDVWSYGITCWEVFSCGEIPYPGLHPQQVLPLLEDGQRLGKPRNPACSDQLYSVLISCWRSNPDNRKTFSELCNIMDTQLNSMSDYLDLNVIANTSFNVSTENLYTVADIDTGEYGRAAAGGRGAPHYVMEVPQADTWAYDDVANDEVHDARSVDELYKKASEDDDKSLNI